MQALAVKHRSFAIDLWGFGDSSKSLDDYAIESQVEMLDGFVDKMGIARPFAIVGHSFGACIALRFAGKSVLSVERIATIAMPLSGNYVNGQLSGKSAREVIDQSRVDYSSYSEVVMGIEKTDPVALEQSIEQLNRLNLFDDLRQIECPILLLYGASDNLVLQPTNVPEATEPGLNNRRCVSLDDSGHFPMLEQPAVFNRLLKEFVDGAGLDELEPKKYWQRRTR